MNYVENVEINLKIEKTGYFKYDLYILSDGFNKLLKNPLFLNNSILPSVSLKYELYIMLEWRRKYVMNFLISNISFHDIIINITIMTSLT